MGWDILWQKIVLGIMGLVARQCHTVPREIQHKHIPTGGGRYHAFERSLDAGPGCLLIQQRADVDLSFEESVRSSPKRCSELCCIHGCIAEALGGTPVAANAYTQPVQDRRGFWYGQWGRKRNGQRRGKRLRCSLTIFGSNLQSIGP